MKISCEEALSLLQAGEIVAIPTDTVYGLAADMRRRDVIAKLFHLKRRSPRQPFLALVPSLGALSEFMYEEPPGLASLAHAFWPGALTLVIPVEANKILGEVRNHQDSMGFRMPDHPMALELLEAFGTFVCTSANLSGQPPAVSAEDVEHSFGNDFPVVDGGRCLEGIASTILVYREREWTLARQGSLSLIALASVLGYEPKAG